MNKTREACFEANSSSTHTLTLCTKSDFDRWINGELIYDCDKEELIPLTGDIMKEKEEEDDYKRYMTYENFNDWSYLDYETFVQEFKTPGNEEVVAFGYYGYEG